jgi:hypothetical protein
VVGLESIGIIGSPSAIEQFRNSGVVSSYC